MKKARKKKLFEIKVIRRSAVCGLKNSFNVGSVNYTKVKEPHVYTSISYRISLLHALETTTAVEI